MQKTSSTVQLPKSIRSIFHLWYKAANVTKRMEILVIQVELPRELKTKQARVGRLFRLVPQEGDEVVPVFALLQASKGHLGAGDIFLWILEVFELETQIVSACRTQSRNSPSLDDPRKSSSGSITYQSIFLPRHRFVLVRVRVRKAFYLTSFTPKETVEVRADLVSFRLFEVMALCASRLLA